METNNRNATQPSARTCFACAPAFFALLGLALAAAAPLVHLALLEHSWSRKTALPALLLLAGAVGLSLYAAWLGRRLWQRLAAGLCLGWAVLFPVALFGFSGLPAAQVSSAAHFRDVVARDHTGATIEFAAELARGPLLLVFYRGHW